MLLYSNADSLKSVLNQSHEPNEKIDLYIQIGKAYYKINLDSTSYFFNKALELAEKTKEDEKIGIVLGKLGDVEMARDQYDAAETLYKRAVNLLVRSGSESNDLARLYLSLGNRFIEKNNYPQAMECYLNGIRFSEEKNDSLYLPFLYNNLGIVYLNQDKPEQALNLYSSSLKNFERIHDSAQIAGITTNIGSIYVQLNNPEIARDYYLKGKEIFHQINNLYGEAHALFKLGLLDLMQKKFTDALISLNKSLELQQKVEGETQGSLTMFLSETYVNLGIVYLELSDLTKAYEFLSKGYELAQQTRQLSLVALASENLSKYYKQSRQFDQALNYYEIYKQYSDSVFNEKNIEELTQLDMQYQFDAELKEADIERTMLEQKNERRILIFLLVSGSLLFLLVIVVLLLKLENNKRKKVSLERKVLSEKLEYTNKELTTYVMYLSRKNEFILSVTEKLKKILNNFKPENRVIISELISELQSNSDMVSWDEFEVRFQQVYTEFYTKLTEKYPDLSPNELRLCAFFRLNMTTKEIAAITYQSLNSIKVARYRLRKKLGIAIDENLVTYLSKF